MLCPLTSFSLTWSVYSPTSHRIRHRNFVWYKCAHMPLVCAHEMFSYSDLYFINDRPFRYFFINDRPFRYFSLSWYIVYMGTYCTHLCIDTLPTHTVRCHIFGIISRSNATPLVCLTTFSDQFDLYSVIFGAIICVVKCDTVSHGIDAWGNVIWHNLLGY